MSEFPEERGVALLGPFVTENAYVAIVDGRRVPFLKFFRGASGVVVTQLDGRWLNEGTSEEEILRWLPILANAMAVAAGYSHFGAESKERPFASRTIGITGARIPGEAKPTLKLVAPSLPSQEEPPT